MDGYIMRFHQRFISLPGARILIDIHDVSIQMEFTNHDKVFDGYSDIYFYLYSAE